MVEREQDEGTQTYPAEKVRQGEVILKTRPRRVIFFAGLIGFVVLAVIFRVLVFA